MGVCIHCQHVYSISATRQPVAQCGETVDCRPVNRIVGLDQDVAEGHEQIRISGNRINGPAEWLRRGEILNLVR